MDRTPEDIEQILAISDILNEYQRWFSDVMLFVSSASASMPVIPQILTKWLKEIDKNKEYQDVTKILSQKAIKLHNCAYQLTGQKNTDEKSNLNDFFKQYEDFMSEMRTAEQSILYRCAGLDVTTSLSNMGGLEKDYERELERKRRYDRSFCFVLGRIDAYDDIVDAYQTKEIKACEKNIAQKIKTSIRVFDGTYYLGQGEFIILCGEAKQPDGAAAVRRVEKLLREERLKISAKGKLAANISMSFCVGEPAPGDDLNKLLEELRDNLNRYDDSKSTTIEHIEQSPLTRYVYEQASGGNIS